MDARCWPVLLALTLVATSAQAQPGPGNGGRWEIEAHGGFTMTRLPSGGDVTLPPAGPAVPTSSPIFPSREVPSWFFGDGASLLNAVNEDFGVDARMLPLESALAVFGLDTGGTATGGFRLRRVFTPVYAAEFSFDLMTGSGRLSDEFLAAVDATRASYEPAFQALLATGPFASPDITTSGRTADDQGRQVALTGTLVQTLGRGGTFRPYVVAGGGAVIGVGTLPAVTLDGRYRFRILDLVPIDETDAVTLEFEQRTTWVGVVGAGVRRDVSDTWGVRVDGRLFFGPNPVRALVTATPSVASGTPAGFIESFTAPSVQFSNDPSTGRQSSLGGPGLQQFEIFTGDGIQTRISIVAGVFVRF